ncbi:MAG: tetraacyldisaccharide 4'-kinase [Phycisphaerae bacterium]|nr:tetraacyldisaccharide 4'-kinase [Phycisphaerae bacterium]MDW8261572.1 tetraacyldisaccharide 4'-kinase [Phycisphaerales bacterium]
MSEFLEHRYLRIIRGDARGFGPTLLRATLALLEPGYGWGVALRNFVFDHGLRKIHHLPRPVISVGNLTTGGTGKTPVVQWLSARLRQEVHAPVGILIRGYRSSDGMSDEATLLATDAARTAPVVCAGADRVASGLRMLREHPSIAVVVMDDGFQHRRLHRDFDLVLINCSNPFGYGRLIPRGLLREPLRALRRADAVLLTHVNRVPLETCASLRQRIRAFCDAPVFACRHELTRVEFQDRTHPVGWLQGRRVVAFAGIGHPKGFRQCLLEAGAIVVGTRWFPDHHAYRRDDLREIQDLVREKGAELAITTEKDFVKLHGFSEEECAQVACAPMAIRFENSDESALLARILARIRPQARGEDRKRPHGGG